MRHPFEYLFLRPRNAQIAAAALIFGIAVADWSLVPDMAFGLLYFFPIFIVAGSLDRWTLAAAALICAALREQFGPSAWDPSWRGRLILAFLAYFGAGLFISEAARSRKAAAIHAKLVEAEIARRQSVEQQLRSIVEGSPAAILTVDSDGKILLANEAAHELFLSEPQTLPGQSIDDYLPELAKFRQTKSLRKLVRTMVECDCHRKSGEPLLAHVWLSAAGPPSSTGLSVVVFDASEELRDREEGALHTLILGARIVASSYFHEVRNLCNAMRVLTTRLERLPGAMDTEEVEGLHSLVKGLETLTSVQMHPEAEESFDIASLRAVLNHLRIVVSPWFEEDEVKVSWFEAGDLPLVRADQSSLLQVFLNLARNARRALEEAERKQFDVSASVENSHVLVRFHNSGPPVKNPQTIFQPFRPGAAGIGVGLHVSQAIARSFGGDLRYEAVPDGSCFTVVLEPRHVSDLFADK